MAKASRLRVPKLRFTSNRGIGWHASYRDRATGLPKRHRFLIPEREREKEARILYHPWVTNYIGGNGETELPRKADSPSKRVRTANVLSGSLLEIASGLIEFERDRARSDNDPRRRGTITGQTFRDRSKQIHDFLAFLNTRHSPGAVSRLRLADLAMEDIEAYNRQIVKKGLSSSQVAKRLQRVRAIIDRAGRPEHGRQLLSWNWDSRDVAHGAPSRERMLPTVKQLQKLLNATDLRGKAWIWLGIGLGLGAKDLAAIHVGQITMDAYDLRRGKTGVERYGETPLLVWMNVKKYQSANKRPDGELLFVTRNREPLVHGTTNTVTLWWEKLRKKIGATRRRCPGSTLSDTWVRPNSARGPEAQSAT